MLLLSNGLFQTIGLGYLTIYRAVLSLAAVVCVLIMDGGRRPSKKFKYLSFSKYP